MPSRTCPTLPNEFKASFDISVNPQARDARGSAIGVSPHETKLCEWRAVFRAGAPNHPASIVMLDLPSGAYRVLKKETDLLDQSELHIADYYRR
jgi:hypothetical protein